MEWLVRALVTTWLALLAVQDAREHEVSNRLTVPPLLLAAGWWAWQGEWGVPLLLAAVIFAADLPRPAVAVPAVAVGAGLLGRGASLEARFVLAAWAVLWAAWALHLVGPADSKVLMALLGFFPEPRLALVLATAHVLLAAYHLARRYGRGAVQVVMLSTLRRPTEEELAEHGVPAMPAYALAGAVYLWLFW